MKQGEAGRIAIAGIYHETNTFAPGLTGLEQFEEEWVVGNDAFGERYGGTRTSMGGAIDAAARHGVAWSAGLYAAATPSGMVSAAAADKLLASLVDSLDPAASGLLIMMHGAMASEQYDDFEGACLRSIRARYGADWPIAMTIDLHANVSCDMVRLADIVVGYDTYPHIDMHERAEEAFELLLRCIRGEISPVRAYAHTGMLVVPQAMMTEQGGMKRLMDRAFEIETHPDVLNVSVVGGFPYCDVPDAGMSLIVTTDGDRAAADSYAAQLKQMAVEIGAQFRMDQWPPEQAVAAALASSEGPVILVEGSDNVGGGAPADATHVLAHLTDIPKRALVVLKDEEAVREAFALGVGGHYEGQVGGRSDRLHGDPVPIAGRIRLLSDGRYRHIGPYMTGQLADMGRTAVVECGLLTVVLTEKRTAPWDLGHIQCVGLRPNDFDLIVVKSAIAWQAAFGPYARKIIDVDSPGCCSANLLHFHYAKVRRPIDPLDAEQE
ncbi:microcystin degradation protein MlrC [Paenibacillus sp. 598K]|uniref:M81 family metallopeptidase n=1 Tax=Paenibacillus sp. 598K TaxID=1117987 RepID=UPI000FF9AB44|nr:M81 family metallopeptidase [Paenibacillus sp. 598K]GBF72497.1 microcystin degradation protein MlrC [Paenibacillus sp. 598K]